MLRFNNVNKISFPLFLRHLLFYNAAKGVIKNIGVIILINKSINFNFFFLSAF